ncbi:MAG: tRNA (adenosine(37)-N6)-threonylcarbamoyltransferase complex ATPase subunit type 1 TsaE [bacterium]
MQKQTTSAQATQDLAQIMAGSFQGGEVLALSGDLGAGKTTFVQGLAKALGVTVNVNSPTFVLLKVYPANKGAIKQLVHIDTYRLSGPDDLLAIGFQDYLNRPDTVMVIEWAEKIRQLLPNNTKDIKFDSLDENTRQLTF